MALDIIYTKNYILQIANLKIKPGDTVMTLANPDSLPYRVNHWFTIKCLHPQRRVVVAHTPRDGTPELDGVPLI
jgi:hypothetical protein